MRLRAIRLRHVRQFGAEGAALETIADGVNVLAAPNEFGKSTIFDALRTALFFKASSRHREVQSLVPDPSGGAPEIEVDLDAAGLELRLAKRFVSSPRARLVERTTGAEIAAGDEVDDWLAAALRTARPGAGAPALLWLQQGTGLQALAKVETAPESLRELVAAEVGDMAGGEAVGKLLARARAARLELITADRRKPRGAFEQAIAERDALTAEVADVSERAQAAEHALDELARVEAALADATRDHTAARLGDELAQARTARDAARLAEERHAARTREHAVASDAEARAARELEALRHAIAAARADLGRLQAAREAAVSARAAGDAAEMAVTSARARRDEERNELAVAVARHERAQRQAANAAALGRLADARARLETARALEIEHARRAAERRAIAVTPKLLAEIEAAVDARNEARARLAARRPTVLVRYDADAAGRVRLADDVLADGVAHPVERRLTLRLDGIGELALDPGINGDAADLEAFMEQAETRLRGRLDAAGVADLAAARAVLRDAEALDLALGEIARRLEELAPDGVAALAADVAGLEAAPREEHDEETLDVGAAATAEREARARFEAADADWRERIEAALPAREQAATARSRVESLEAQVRDAHERLGPEEAWPETVVAAAARLEAARRATATAAAALAAAAAGSRDVAAAEATVRRLEEAVANHEQDLARLRLARARLEGELRAAAAEGVGERLAEAEARLEASAARVAAFAAQRDALDVLVEVLGESEAAARERFTGPVLEAMRPLVAQVLPDGELELDADFGPSILRRPARADSLDRLSGGTREQIAVLARLGFARLLARHGRGLPVVLDDALVFSDDARIERMFTALTMAASEVQVLVLTCRERSFRTLGGNALRLAPWRDDRR